jgi:cellulase/cellobiase CelA1
VSRAHVSIWKLHVHVLLISSWQSVRACIAIVAACWVRVVQQYFNKQWKLLIGWAYEATSCSSSSSSSSSSSRGWGPLVGPFWPLSVHLTLQKPPPGPRSRRFVIVFRRHVNGKFWRLIVSANWKHFRNATSLISSHGPTDSFLNIAHVEGHSVCNHDSADCEGSEWTWEVLENQLGKLLLLLLLLLLIS